MIANMQQEQDTTEKEHLAAPKTSPTTKEDLNQKDQMNNTGGIVHISD